MTKSKTKSFATPFGMAALFTALWMFLSEGTTAEIAFDLSTLPGIQTAAVPWPAEIEHLRSRLQAIGLPAGRLLQERTKCAQDLQERQSGDG
jgi:hypothetical protein